MQLWVLVSLHHLTKGEELSWAAAIFPLFVCVCVQLVLWTEGGLTFPSLCVGTVGELWKEQEILLNLFFDVRIVCVLISKTCYSSHPSCYWPGWSRLCSFEALENLCVFPNLWGVTPIQHPPIMKQSSWVKAGLCCSLNLIPSRCFHNPYIRSFHVTTKFVWCSLCWV